MGYQLQTLFSEPPEVKIEKFQWPLERELPEDSKTHPTFIPSAIFEGVYEHIKHRRVFFGTPCIV